MATYLFYDTIRLNPDAGGVLNVSQTLLSSMRESLTDRVEAVSEKYPRLYRSAERLKLSRFVVDTLVYNYHRLRRSTGGAQLQSIFPNYFLPLTPFGRHRDSIVVVHDLQYKVLPQNFSRGKRLWLNWSLRRVAGSLADVVFISGSSRKDFERHFAGCRRSVVIFNPVDAAALRGATDERPQQARYLIASYHYYPHKNFDGILTLFARMRSAGLVDWLDITGNGAADVAHRVDAVAPELRACIRHRGLVPREELVRLYRGATAFVSLSKSEGFNLSAAEAATLQVPLLLSDIPVHRELFENYGLLIGDESCPMECVARYLASHEKRRPVWPLAEACRPSVVAARYLQLGHRMGAMPEASR